MRRLCHAAKYIAALIWWSGVVSLHDFSSALETSVEILIMFQARRQVHRLFLVGSASSTRIGRISAIYVAVVRGTKSVNGE